MDLLKNIYSLESYTSIDEMPIYNWNKTIENNDVKYLLKGKVTLSREIILLLQLKWKRMYNEYIKHFGFGERFLEM